MQSSIIIVLVTILVACEAYRVSKPIMRVRMLKMSDSEEPFQPEETAEGQLKFDMNRRVRLGRSKDQDGKSNIWSIEPTMEVDESEVINHTQSFNSNYTYVL